MTRRRRLLFFSLLILLLGLAARLSLYWLGPGPSVITQEAANIIRRGMTVSDVECILGGPARDETTAPHEFARRELPLLKPGAESREWLCDLAWVRVEFDQGVVVGTVSTAAAQQKTALDTRRRFLGL
jgi:hypothetical protein